MDLLTGVQLCNKTGKYVLANHALKDKSILFIFFASLTTSKEFIETLKEAYEGSRAVGKGGGVEVIIVSEDESASDQMKLLGRGGDWWSVKWGHPVCDQLREALGVEVRDAARARVISVDSVTAGISEEGTEAVKSRGRAAFARWEQTKFFRIDVSGVEKLRSQNTEEVWRGAVDILIRLLTNIQREPSNTRYRVIKKTNEKIQNELLSANGAMEILKGIGFILEDDELILPLGSDQLKIVKFLVALKNLKN